MILPAFADPIDLAAVLGQRIEQDRVAAAEVLLAIASDIIRGYTNQMISAVAGDVVDIDAGGRSAFLLPQLPVTGVASIGAKGRAVALEAAAISGQTATLTAPGFSASVGDLVVVEGVVPAEYNGAFEVTGVPSSGVVTVDIPSAPAGPGTSFGTIMPAMVPDNDFRVETAGIIRRLSTATVWTASVGSWSSGWPESSRPNIFRVTYDHGFDPVPQAIKGVCMAVAARMWKAWANPMGISAETIGSYSVSYAAGEAAGAASLELTDAERDILDTKYTAMVPA